MKNQTAKLTKKVVDSLPFAEDSKTRYTVRDSLRSGLAIRVSARQKKFVVWGRVNGKKCMVTIGDAESWSLEQARKRAKEVSVAMDRGENPNAKRAKEAVLDMTLRDALDDYLATNSKLKERTRKEYRAILNSKLPDWLDKPVASITPHMVKKRYQSITEKAKTQGDLAFRVARVMFNNAIGLMEDAGAEPIRNPCNVLSRQKMWRGVVRKQTVIPPNDLPGWWACADEIATRPERRTIADFFRFLLLTGFRKDEARLLKWEDVDLDNRTIMLRDTKNRRDHTAPIATHALEILTERRLDAGPRKYVFESDRGLVSNLRYFQQAIKDETNLWITPHDLRRTFISIGADFLPELVLKRLVNHVNSANVTEGYVIKAVDDLRDPMQRLENRILRLANVAPEEAKVIDLEKHRERHA